MEVEVHVCSERRPEGTSIHIGSTTARVIDIVIRLDAMHWKARDPAYIDRIASMMDPVMALLYLQTVTLETIEEDQSSDEELSARD